MPAVDYQIGVSGQLKRVESGAALPACATYTAATATNFAQIDITSSPCTLDHYDFTGDCVVIDVGASGGTVSFTYNKIAVTNTTQECSGSTGLGLLMWRGPVNLVATNNTFEGAVPGSGPGGVNYNQNVGAHITQNSTATGNLTAKFNAFYHCGPACISIGAAGANTFSYNYMQGGGAPGSGDHADFWINNDLAAGVVTVTSSFNTVYYDQSSYGILLSTADCYFTNNVTTQYLNGSCSNEVVVANAGAPNALAGGYLTRMDPFGNAVTVVASNPAFTWTSNTLANSQQVALGGTTAPTGLPFGQAYYVRDLVGNTFNVATSVGGAAVIPSTTGTSVTVSSQGPYVVQNIWYDASLTSVGVHIHETSADGAMTNVQCKHNVNILTGGPAAEDNTGTLTPFPVPCTP